MTAHEAIQEVLKVGTIRVEKGKLKLRFPKPEQPRLEPAIETLRRNRETALRSLSRMESDHAEIPQATEWPQSLSELAEEVGQHGDIEAARQEVWKDWCEWKAFALNRLVHELGVTGEPGRITAETVRHGKGKGGPDDAGDRITISAFNSIRIGIPEIRFVTNDLYIS